MSLFRSSLANAKLALIVSLIALALSAIINVVSIHGLISEPKQIRVFVPPQIPAEGIVLKQEQLSPTQVYSFVYYAWSLVNHWQTDGQREYPVNIEKIKPCLTISFYNLLKSDEKARDKGGELAGRMRTLTGMNDNVYDPSDVQSLSDGSWIVTMQMRLTETMSEKEGQLQVIKDVVMQYKIHVVHDSDAGNLWGLAIEGFAEEPVRISTNV